jgi:hypothetical protein
MTKAKYTRKALELLHLKQSEHVQRQIEARSSKTSHIMTRRKWSERQTNANYRNEYDRIRGECSQTRLPDTDRARLQKREEELKQLFSTGNT